jgi:hypothetical protein
MRKLKFEELSFSKIIKLVSDGEMSFFILNPRLFLSNWLLTVLGTEDTV